ncbi:MAG: LLM class flavin-dependent oxidoreductase [Solirubrobacterales bacterium]|nr:LLM class flavin-dependent oxidoreductase [Solirubrobacterales bacterium]OJU93419.1 MAG: hypothetical protein BGO23_12200 [Solirubrobacterales bacterium 67-14]
MRLGTVHSFQRLPGSPIHPVDVYESEIEQVVRSEQAGYDWVNLTEHHVTDDGYCPALLPVLGALANATETIGLSSGMLILPLHEPVRIAEETAVVDLLSRGRLTLGLAAGYRVREFEAMGVPFARRGARFEEALEILTLAWRGEPFSYEGEFFQLPEITVTPRPFQQAGPRLWLGGVSGPALRRAARFDSPCFPGATHTIDEARESLARLKEIRREAGQEEDPGMVLPRLAYLADTTAEAREKAWPAIAAMFDRYVAYGSPPELRDALEDWELLDRYVIVGDEEHCRRGIRECHEAGVTDLMLQFALPALEPARAMEAMLGFPALIERA